MNFVLIKFRLGYGVLYLTVQAIVVRDIQKLIGELDQQARHHFLLESIFFFFLSLQTQSFLILLN
jgi:hypothetical protein